MTAILEVRNLHKSYNKKKVLDGLDFSLNSGEIMGLLGNNGAGKTTSIRLMLGLEKPCQGEVTIAGLPPSSTLAKACSNVVFQNSVFPDHLKASEFLKLVTSHFSHSENVDSIINELGIEPFAHSKLGILSGGQRRKVALAAAFLSKPKLIFLDEPTTGLDRQSRNTIYKKIRDFRSSGGSILLTTHYIEEAEELCDSFAIMDKGHIYKRGTLEETRKILSSKILEFGSKIPPSVHHKKLPDCERFQIFSSNADQLVQDFVHSGYPFKNLTIRNTSLSDVLCTLENGR